MRFCLVFASVTTERRRLVHLAGLARLRRPIFLEVRAAAQAQSKTAREARMWAVRLDIPSGG